MEDQIKALQAFYGHYDPKNKPSDTDLNDLAKRYSGNEGEMWGELYGHYDPQNPLPKEDLDHLVSLKNPYAPEKKSPDQTVSSPASGVVAGTALEGTQSSPATVNIGAIGSDGAADVSVTATESPDIQKANEAQLAAAEQRRSEHIATVAMGLDKLAEMKGVNPMPWKTQLEGIINDPNIKTQAERDAKAAQAAYKIFQDQGIKRTAFNTGDDRDQQFAFEDTWKALGETERNLRQDDPQAWQQMMSQESAKHYSDIGVNKSGDELLMQKSIDDDLAGLKQRDGDSFKDTPESQEAFYRLQARDFANASKKFATQFNTTDDPQLRGMEAKANEYLKKADDIRAQRHAEVRTKIDQLRKTLDQPGLPTYKLKAGREALRQLEEQDRGIIDPSYEIAVATATNKEEIDAANADPATAGKTPKERLDKYYANLVWEARRLEGRMLGDATENAAVAEQTSIPVPGMFSTSNEDEKRYKEVRQKIRSLAPVVLLNEADIKRGNAGTAMVKNFAEIMTGGGGVIGADMGLETAQNRANDITEGMIVAGLDPQKAMTTDYRQAINRNAEGFGLGDFQYWGEQAGMVGAILAQAAPGGLVTKGVGANAMIARANQYLQTSTKAGKVVRTLAKVGMNSLKRGVEFEAAGLATPNQRDELNFASGLLGGMGESVGKGVFKAGEKLIAKVFGDSAQQAYGLISQYGAELRATGKIGAAIQGRAAMGLGESLGESVESIVHVFQQSEPGKSFQEGLEEEFGKTFDDHVKFFVSTFALGMALGGGHDGGVGSSLIESARQQYAEANPEQQAQMDAIIEDTGQGLEEAHTAAVDETTKRRNDLVKEAERLTQEIENNDPAKKVKEARLQRVMDELHNMEVAANEQAAEEPAQPAQEPAAQQLTPEAQAAKDEIAKREETDKRMAEAGLSDRLEQNMSNEERIRADLKSLQDQQQRQELTDNEKKRMAHLQTVVTGLDQIEANEHLVEANVESLPKEPIEVGEAIVTPPAKEGGKPTMTIETSAGQIEAPFDMAEYQASLQAFDQQLSDESDAFVDEAPVAEPIQQSAPEVNPLETTTQREAPKRRDQQIVDQINEFFSGLAGTIGENAAAKIKEYADRVIADPTKRESIIKGLPKKWVDSIDEAVALQKPADTAVVDVTGRSTAIPTEPKNRFEAKKGKGAANGGKSKSLLDESIDFENKVSEALDKYSNPKNDAEEKEASKAIEEVSQARRERNRKLSEKSNRDATSDEVYDEVHDAILSGDEEKTNMPDGYSATVIDSYYEPIMRRYHTIAEVTDPKGGKYYIDVNTYKKRKIGETYGKGNETKKRKPNPNRKTKTKPAKDLTPAQTVDEVAATTIEAEENPTPENLQRAKEVEQQFEANIDTAELDAEIAAEESKSPITPEEAQISKELNITEDEARRSKKGTKARTRKSTAIVETLEGQAEAAIASGDAEAAAETIEAIEVAENAILSGIEPSNDFQGNYGVSEIDLANEYNSLGKNATIEQAYKNLTGNTLRGSDARNTIDSDEQKAEFKEFVTDFLNALPRAGIRLKKPLEVGHDIVINLTPIPIKPVKKTGVEATNNNVAADQDKAALTGIYFDGDQMVATDASQLVVIRIKESEASIIEKFKAAIIKARSKVLGLKGAQAEADRIAESLSENGLEGNILNFNGGNVVDQRYPDYKAVIPAEDDVQSKPIPIQQLIDVANGAAITLKNLVADSYQRAVFVVRLNGESEMEMGINPSLLLRNLQTLQANGATSVVLGFTKPNRAINIYANNGNRGLVMPIMLSKVDTETMVTTTPYEINTVAPKKQSTSPKKEGKKDAGKAVEETKPTLAPGVEDQFVLANVRGDRTEYRKKDGVWEKRTHKLGTKVRDQQFVRDWEEVSEEDVDYVEKMSKKTELDREVLNSAKEWVATWGNFVTGRGQMRGNAFSKVDAGLTALGLDLTSKTFKLGLAIARALAAKGMFTYENWKKDMLGATGGYAEKFLKNAWDQVTHVLPEGSTDPGIQSNVAQPTQEEQANEKSKETKKKKNERGTYDTFEQYEETNPASMNEVLASVDRSYETMNLSDLFNKAKKAIQDAGGFARTKVFDSLMKTVIETAEKPMQQAKRMMAIRFYGELADQLSEKMEGAETMEEMEDLRKMREEAVSRLDRLMQITSEDNTYMGQATATMAQWRFLMANTVGYAKSKIDAYNKKLMEENTEAGKKRRRNVKETVEELNDMREIDGQATADSESVDNSISDIEEGKPLPKPPKDRAGKPKKKTGLGMTREQADKMMADALADIGRAARQGFAGSGATPAVFDFMDAAGRYGVAIMAKGIVTFKEWSAKMRADIGTTAAQEKELWDNHEHDGKTLAELSKEELDRATEPAKPRKKGEPTLRKKIRDTINEHFKKGAEKKSLEQRLMDNVGLTEDEAAHVTNAVRTELEARTKAKIEARAKALKRKPPRAAAKAKTDTERAIEAMVDDEFTDEMVQEIFADRLGLQTQLTPEQMARTRALGRALEATKPGTRAQTVAAMALDRYMYEVLPAPAWTEKYGQMFKSIVYANMLMGLPTHLKNLVSSGAMTVSSFVETLANVSKWKRSLRQAVKAKDGERVKTLLRANPLTEIFVKFSAMGRGWAKGAQVAWDIMVHGTMDSKYIDAGKASIGRLSPFLERHRFGKYNPANVFKYVGRALSAEDAWMYAINNEMELADATRRHFLESDVEKGKTFVGDVHRRMAFSNPLYQEAKKEAEAEINALQKALDFTPKQLARAISIRAKEILIDKIGLTEAEMQQAEDIARSRVFTLKRNGVWGQTASLMKKINAHPIAGTLSWIWMPFADIIGNVGDTFNDYFPGYGVIRANGISPTALLRSTGRGTASLSEPLEGSIEDRIKQSMGSRQDQKYYEQMGRAWFGSILMLGAMMLMDDDDDDDFIRFTGKNDPTHKNYLIIGGQPIMTWELIPSIAPVAAIMSEAHAFHKLHPEEKRSLQDRLLYAMGAVEQSVAGLSVAESVQNLNQVLGTVLSSATGVGNYGDKVDLKKGLTSLRDELGKQGIDMLSRVNPLRNPVIGQVQQIFDPRVFSHSEIRQTLDYAYQGIIYRYADDEDGNPRMAMVDIFGEETKKLPAEESFAFLSYANEKIKDKKWKFLADHGGLEIMSRASNRNWLMEDDESEYGVIARKLTDKEFGTYAKIAGKNFAKELERYMSNETQWKKDYKRVEVTLGGTITGLQEKVLALASKARSDAKKTLNAMPVSQGGLGKKAL